MSNKYRPSSGSEGVWFESKFCAQCVRQPLDPNDGGCLIQLNAMCFEIDEDEYPQEWILQNDAPYCTAFDSRKKKKWEKFSSPKQFKLWGDGEENNNGLQ